MIKSLANLAWIPGPEYFDAGWMKVNNAAKEFPSISVLIPEGGTTVNPKGLTSPYPSISRHEGGRICCGGKSFIGTVQPAKRVLP